MADSGYSTPSWGLMSASSGARGSEVVAPLLSAHAMPFSQPFPPPSFEVPYAPHTSPPMSQYPDLPNDPFHNQSQGRSPYPPDGGHQMFYSPPPRLHPYLASQPRPPPAFQNRASYPRMENGGSTDTNAMFPVREQLQGMQPYFPPSSPGFGGPTLPATGPTPTIRRQHYSMTGFNPSRQYGGPVRMSHPATQDQPRPMHSPNRRLSHQEYHSHNRAHNDEMRRSSTLIDAQGRRSERSISPRTSSRRSYDRYSFDLPQSSTSSDAEEAAARAPPSSRMRHRPREMRPRFFTQHQHIDPNVATARQIQELKDKLPRHLPSDLPKDMSTTCDICSKDYSSTHVKPVEEEEVAIELPCGHYFGEFCIFEWVCVNDSLLEAY